MVNDYSVNEELVKKFGEILTDFFEPLNLKPELPMLGKVVLSGEPNKEQSKKYWIEIKIGDFLTEAVISGEANQEELKEEVRFVAGAYWEFTGSDYTTKLGQILFPNREEF